MSKIMTAKEWLIDNEYHNRMITNYSGESIDLDRILDRYASYIAQEFAEWILTKPITQSHVEGGVLYNGKLVSSKSLFELFKKENGL